MFSLSQVLSDAHGRAVKAWAKGAPKASSPAEARRQWAPFLDTWAAYVAGNFLGSLTHRVGRERVGWIDDAEFWTTFWNARTHDHKVHRQIESEQVLHMRAYVEGAAATGSMSFFTTMPSDAMPLVQSILDSTAVMAEPCVVEWFRTNSFNGDPGVENRQRLFWNSVHWFVSDESVLHLAHAAVDGQAMLGRVCRALNAGMGESARLQILGNLLTNLPKDFDRNEAIAFIEANVNDCAGIDLCLVALCSGYAVNDSPTAQTLAHLGKALMTGESFTPELRTLGGDILPMLEIFAPGIDSSEDLYHAALQLGLYPMNPVQTVEMDGSIFIHPDEN